MKNALRYTLATILLAGIILLITITYMNYKVMPTEVYKLDSKNLIDDGSFENFNEPANDCCNAKPEESKVFASKSSDVYKGDYSLNLTSKKQCACINKEILNINNAKTYLLSFNYKGDNPRFCNWVTGDNNCLSNKNFDTSKDWSYYGGFIKFTNKSTSASIYLYADSSGTPVTNLYDDLQVHQLVPITPSMNQEDYKLDQEYVIKTNPSNVVSAVCADKYLNAEGNCPIEKLSDDGYYLVRGAPQVTLKFPWTELVMIIIMMLIVIRLLFRKQFVAVEEEVKYELRKELKEFR